MGYIYKITNDINDKVYIGKTVSSISNRWNGHIQDSKKYNKSNRPLYNAFHKYGINHFSIKQIEECPNDILEQREQFWIQQYDSFNNGYNATLGGEGLLVYNHSAIISRLLENPYPYDVADEFGCSYTLIMRIVRWNNIPYERLRTQKTAGVLIQKPVGQYDKKTNELLNTFPSAKAAGQWCLDNGLTLSKNACQSIGSACRGNNRLKSAYGYTWRFINN